MAKDEDKIDDQKVDGAQDDDEIEIKVEESEAGKSADDADSAEGKDGEGKKADEKQDQQFKKKKTHRGNNGNERINQLWAQVQEKDAALEQERTRASAAETARAKTESIAGQSFEENFKAQRELLTYKLRDAEIAGDADAKAKIMSEMSDISAKQAQIERWKVENSTKPASAAQPQKKEQPTEREATQSGMSFEDVYENSTLAGKTWLEGAKDWFDSDSENFNQEMTADVVTKAQNLERQWQRAGRGSDIGTKAYYRELDKYIQENWAEDGEEDAAPVARKTNGYAAPVNTRMAPGQQTARQKNIVTLSKDERDLAINLTRKHANGVEFTDDEKIKDYAKNKDLTKAMKPGDTININTVRRA